MYRNCILTRERGAIKTPEKYILHHPSNRWFFALFTWSSFLQIPSLSGGKILGESIVCILPRVYNPCFVHASLWVRTHYLHAKDRWRRCFISFTSAVITQSELGDLAIRTSRSITVEHVLVKWRTIHSIDFVLNLTRFAKIAAPRVSTRVTGRCGMIWFL